MTRTPAAITAPTIMLLLLEWRRPYWRSRRTTVGITFDDFHDQSSGVFRGLGRADEVHRPLTVLTLRFAYDIHMAAGFVLNVTDSFTATSDNETNSSIGNKYLCALFCVRLHELVYRALLWPYYTERKLCMHRVILKTNLRPSNWVLLGPRELDLD